MPEKNREERRDTEPAPGEENKRHHFISEKIVRQPLSRRQIARLIGLAVFCGALFGMTAAVCFVAVRPGVQRLIGDQEGQNRQPVTIPKDEPETTAAPAETSPAAQEETEATEPIEELVRGELENYQYTVKDLESVFEVLREIASEADRSVVSVHSIRHQTDWFDNPIETTGQFAGLIVAQTDTEALILTPVEAMDGADSIEVVFQDGTTAAGAVKQTDQVSGLAVVSVDLAQLSPDQIRRFQVIELGNSYSVSQGDLVITVGGPAGAVHSYGYGVISYIYKNVQVPDGSSRLMATDASGNAQMGTFILNTSGQLIGWVTEQYSGEGKPAGSMTLLATISDYKGILEDLTNGVAAPYLGIRGQEVSAAMEEDGLPRGIYVTESVTDGPAYNAGIQNGDIITRMNGMDVPTMKEFRNQLEALTAGQQIQVTVERNGAESYTAIEFSVTIGAR